MLLLTYCWASLKDRASVSAFCSRLLNQATKLYNTATVVPINHTFFTISAIIAGEFWLSMLKGFYPHNKHKWSLPQSNGKIKEYFGYKECIAHILLATAQCLNFLHNIL